MIEHAQQAMKGVLIFRCDHCQTLSNQCLVLRYHLRR
jgi:hypothetical protein